MRWRRWGAWQKPGNKNLTQTRRLRTNLAEARGCGIPPGTYQNPAKPCRTRWNGAETWRKPGGTRRKGKLKGGWLGVYLLAWFILPTTPRSTYFLFAGFRQVSTGFLCRVPLGFRRVPLGSAAPPGSARFARSVPPGGARFCWVSANKVPAPFNLLLGLCQVLARRLPIKEVFLAIARALSKSAYEKNHQ